MRARAIFTVIAAVLLLPATALAQEADLDNLCHHDPTHELCLPDVGGIGIDAPAENGAPDDVEEPREVDVAVLGTQLEAESGVGGAQLAMTGTNALIASGVALALLLAGGLTLMLGRRRSVTTG